MSYKEQLQGSPSQDRTNRWPGDQLLRSHGFVILERPKTGHSIWGRNGQKYTYRQAMKLVRQEERMGQ